MARPNRRLARYTPYVDGPDPLAPPVDLAEALDAIGEDVMAGYSPERAMREFLRRGGRDQAGLDELARRVAERRAELTRKNNLDGTLQEVKELLDRAVLAERKQLARDVDMDEGDRALAQMQLDNLPSSPAAAVDELNGYDWRSAEARQEFEKIKDLLGREVLDQRFAGMKQALENATDADRDALNEMLADLNALLEARRLSQDTQEQFDDFMAKHGDYFPEQPAHARRAAGLPGATGRRGTADAQLDDAGAARRARRARAAGVRLVGPHGLAVPARRQPPSLRPGEDWGGSERLDGQNGLGLGDGTGVFQDLADLDALAEQLAQSYEGSQLDDLDLEKLARQLGSDAVVDARTLQRLEKALRESGTIRRGSDGQLALTPKAMRQLGAAVLRAVAETMSAAAGRSRPAPLGRRR